MPPIHGGTEPESLLCETSIILKCWRWQRFEEICPSNLFLLNKSTLIWVLLRKKDQTSLAISTGLQTFGMRDNLAPTFLFSFLVHALANTARMNYSTRPQQNHVQRSNVKLIELFHKITTYPRSEQQSKTETFSPSMCRPKHYTYMFHTYYCYMDPIISTSLLCCWWLIYWSLIHV